MNFKEVYYLLCKCFNKFNHEYNDCNFKVITHKETIIGFNLRQSKLPSFFGLAESYLSKIDYNRKNDFIGLVNLVSNKYHYLEAYNNGEITTSYVFEDDALEKLSSFWNLCVINAYNAKFAVFSEDEKNCYLFVNGINDYKKGTFIIFKKDGSYYVPEKFVTVNDEEAFKQYAQMGKIEIISVVKKRNKVNNKNNITKRDTKAFREVSDFLYSYDLGKFELEEDDIQDVMFDTQFDVTRLVSPHNYGFEFSEFIKTNKFGLMVMDSQLEELKRLRSSVEQLRKENESLQEITYNALEELYYTNLEQNTKKERKGKVLQLLRSLRKESR